jgi:hypothetical protein
VRARSRLATLLAAAGAAAGALALPASASAHGLIQRADLPLPEWLFGWASVTVVIVSFVALAVLWPAPKLEGKASALKPLGGLGRVVTAAPTRAACAVLGVGLFVLTIWSGFAGTQTPEANFAPTFVYVVFWVGFVPASVLFGDVFRAVNPWRVMGEAGEWVVRRLRGARRPRPYPERLGRWPAVAGLCGFAWMELAYAGHAVPADIATAACVYTAFTFAGIARYGTAAWIENAEAFSVYYNLFSRLSPFTVRDGAVATRPVLAGLTDLRRGPGLVGLLSTMIGTVTFDGLSQGALWKSIEPHVESAFSSLGLGLTASFELAGTVGMLAAISVIGGFYALGTLGARSVGGGISAARLRAAFVHSLVPIAVVYVMAHYLTLFVFQGQAVRYLASDPLGNGWNLFGTAQAAINYGVLSQNATWYLQVGFVVAGHVAALALAHDRALAIYSQTRLAVRSQYWMLIVMVGFTGLALWLLAHVGT